MPIPLIQCSGLPLPSSALQVSRPRIIKTRNRCYFSHNDILAWCKDPPLPNRSKDTSESTAQQNVAIAPTAARRRVPAATGRVPVLVGRRCRWTAAAAATGVGGVGHPEEAAAAKYARPLIHQRYMLIPSAIRRRPTIATIATTIAIAMAIAGRHDAAADAIAIAANAASTATSDRNGDDDRKPQQFRQQCFCKQRQQQQLQSS